MREADEKNLFNFYRMQRDRLEKLRVNYIVHWTVGHINEETFQKLLHQISEIGKMLAGLINYLKKTTVEGTKNLKEPESLYQALHFEFEEQL